MKRIFFFIIFILLSCNRDSNDVVDSNSDCQNPNHNLIYWTIIDDASGKKIAGAQGTLYYGEGFSEFIMFDTTSSGLTAFCFPLKGEIKDGFIRAEGYKDMVLTGIIASDISTIRLTPIN